MENKIQLLNNSVHLVGKCINHGYGNCKSNQCNLIEKTLNWTTYRSSRDFTNKPITVLTCSRCYMNLIGLTNILSKDDYLDLWDEITNIMVDIEIDNDKLISKL